MKTILGKANIDWNLTHKKTLIVVFNIVKSISSKNKNDVLLKNNN